MDGQGPVGRGSAAAKAGTAVRALLGATTGAVVLWALHVPAGILVGAVIGSACANRLPWPTGPALLPSPLRNAAFLMLGAVAGVRLQAEALRGLARIALPVAVGVAALLVVTFLLALMLMRLARVDATTAVLATAPGGLSEIVGLAVEHRSEVSLVLAVHTIRVLVVVLVALPLLVALLPAP